MAGEESDVAESELRGFEVHCLGATPDGTWVWYEVRKLKKNGHDTESVVGIVAQSMEVELWGGDNIRYYRTMSYEPGHKEGSISYSTAKSVNGAAAWMIDRYEKTAKFYEERGEHG